MNNPQPENAANPLLVKDNDGNTPIHFATWNRELRKIPRELLTEETLLVKNNNGHTPLHFATWNRELHQIPHELLTEETLLVKDNDGDTPIHYLAAFGNLHQIPPELLTKETLLVKNNDGSTPIHWAARYGNLNQIPLELLTKETLLIRSNNGATPIHMAAQRGHLDQIPRELLTEETLSVSDNDGETPIHVAAQSISIHQIPLELLTKETLLVKNNEGTTPIHQADLNQIPPKLLTKETLSVKNNDGNTPIHFADQSGNLDQIPSKILLEIILPKRLHEHLHDLTRTSPELFEATQSFNNCINITLKNPELETLFKERRGPLEIFQYFQPNWDIETARSFLKLGKQVVGKNILPKLHETWKNSDRGTRDVVSKAILANPEAARDVLKLNFTIELPWFLLTGIKEFQKPEADRHPFFHKEDNARQHLKDFGEANPDYSLHPEASLRRLDDAVRKWDYEVQTERVQDWIDNHPGKLDTPFSNLEKFPTSGRIGDITLARLDTVRQLIEEGATMNHCVVTYAQKAWTGDCVIYHATRGDKHATLEINPTGEIAQIQGPHNSVVAYAKEIEHGWPGLLAQH